jgi:hypothetical protein
MATHKLKIYFPINIGREITKKFGTCIVKGASLCGILLAIALQAVMIMFTTGQKAVTPESLCPL